MSLELYLLCAAVFLLLVHVSVQSLTYKAQVGNAATVGARDTIEPATAIAGRAERALRNFNETFPAFVALVLVVELANLHNDLTIWGAVLYVAFRISYLPLYLVGLPWVRTISWNLATLGLAVMLVGVLWR